MFSPQLLTDDFDIPSMRASFVTLPAALIACSFLIIGSFMNALTPRMLDMPNINVKQDELLSLPNHFVRHTEQKINNNASMSLKERINELFRDSSDKIPADLARYAKVSRASVSAWMSGETKTITGDNAFAVARFFGVNPEWVQNGKGKKHDQSIANAEAIETKGFVPLISWVRAGEWCEAINNYPPGEAEMWLPCPVPHSKGTFALKIQGDSMTSQYPGQRTYPEGSIIYVDPEVEVTSGRRVVAKLPESNEVTFKEYRYDSGKHLLKPLNTQYPTIEITEETHFCGVVIGQFLPE